jgi:hypothetical protein
VYQPESLSTPPTTVAAHLAARAHAGRLTIYAGAGLSQADPTDLPGAAKLANLISTKLSGVIDFEGIDCWDLLAVADRVAEADLGLALLRETALEVADFVSARYNYAHEVVALLLSEGAATIFETNYDDCIERAAQREHLPVARTATELLNGHTGPLIKAHGCATLPNTMLFTTAELASVDLWATATVTSKLTSDTVAFIGIGSVADYVQSSIETVLGTTGVDHLVLVGPGLEAWQTDPDLDWRKLLPDLTTEQRVASPAEEFCDALLRAYLLRFRGQLNELVSGLEQDHPQRLGMANVLSALEAMAAVPALRWLRRTCWRLGHGQSAASLPAVLAGLVALSSLVGDSWNVHKLSPCWITVSPKDETAGDHTVHVLGVFCAEAKSGSQLAREVEHRVQIARTEGTIPRGALVIALCSGPIIGGLGAEELLVERESGLSVALAAAGQASTLLPGHVIDPTTPDHLIDGTRPGDVYVLNAATLGVAG